MLVLTRKVGENVVVDGRIVVKVLRLDSDGIKLGFEAPVEVTIHRQEVYDEIHRCNEAAAAHGSVPLPRLKSIPPVHPAP